MKATSGRCLEETACSLPESACHFVAAIMMNFWMLLSSATVPGTRGSDRLSDWQEKQPRTPFLCLLMTWISSSRVLSHLAVWFLICSSLTSCSLLTHAVCLWFSPFLHISFLPLSSLGFNWGTSSSLLLSFFMTFFRCQCAPVLRLSVCCLNHGPYQREQVEYWYTDLN